MKRKYKIIFAAQDPGGFNSISPVIKKIKKDKAFDITVILTNQASEFAESQGIRHLNANKLLFIKIKKFIEDKKPDLIFTATSDGPSIEKKILTIARAKKIPTISIVDFWSNYRIRFSDKRTSNFKYLPDYVLAIDEIMKKEMITKGIPKEKIIITGNPFFDNLRKGNRKKERKNLVVFFSQPFSELIGKNGKSFLGLNEIKIFEDFLEALEKFNPKSRIIIKFHPRAKNLNKFNEIIKKSKLSILIEKKLSAEDLIEKSEIICGMNSMVLFQAALIGKKVISYQPNVNKNSDPLISNRFGLSQAVYEKKDILSALNKLFLGKEQNRKVKLIEKYTKNKSTEKVISFMTNLLKNKKVVCVIQARMNSTRLKKKVLLKISGKTLIENIFRRLKSAQEIDDIVLATSWKKENDVLVKHAKDIGLKHYRGSEEDLVSRFYGAARKFKADAIVRITADCPLVDPKLVDKMVKFYRKNYKKFDLITNSFPPTFPHGLDLEILPFSTLKKLDTQLRNPLSREWLTCYIMENPKKFRIYNFRNPVDLSLTIRCTIDYAEDLVFVKKIFKALDREDEIFTTSEIINFLRKNPQLLKINANRMDRVMVKNIRSEAYYKLKQSKNI